MPRYFFHIHDGVDIIDEEGVELANADEAKNQAIVASGEMLRETASQFWGGEIWQMHVVDDTGATVCRLNFSAVI